MQSPGTSALPPFHVRFKELRMKLSLPIRAVAQRCGVSKALVRAWEEGEAIPNPRDFARLRKVVMPELDGYSASLHELWSKGRHLVTEPAPKPSEPEPLVPAPKPGGGLKVAPRQVGTVLVDGKLIDTIGRDLGPPGARTKESRQERVAYVKERLHAGESLDVIRVELKSKFGIGLGYSRLMRIREQVNEERIRNQVIEELARVPPSAMAPPPPPRPEPGSAPVAKALDVDISERVLASVRALMVDLPELASLLVTVDAGGVMSVSYDVRVVTTSSHSVRVVAQRPT